MRQSNNSYMEQIETSVIKERGERQNERKDILNVCQ